MRIGMNYSELLNSLKIRGSQPHGPWLKASTGGEEGAAGARLPFPPFPPFPPLPPLPPFPPSSHIFYPSSSCSSCCCACTCGVQVPSLLPPPPLPSFPPPLLPSSPLSPLLVASVPFTRSSLRSTCLLSLCSRLRRATTLSLSSLPFPPPSPFISPCFFLPLHLTLLAMRVA